MSKRRARKTSCDDGSFIELEVNVEDAIKLEEKETVGGETLQDEGGINIKKEKQLATLENEGTLIKLEVTKEQADEEDCVKQRVSEIEETHGDRETVNRHRVETSAQIPKGTQTKKMKSAKKPVQCTVCSKVLSSASSLQKHENLHFRKKEVQCKFCDRLFMYASQALDHEKIHTGGKPNKCRFCSKRFLLLKQVKAHEVTHTRVLAFNCDICNESFSARSTLVAHKRIHSGDKPYKCALCNKTFRVQGKMARHMRSHTGEKPYKCRFCDERFIRRYRVKQHEQTHYLPSLEALKCRICNKGFSSISGAKKHQEKVHPKQQLKEKEGQFRGTK